MRAIGGRPLSTTTVQELIVVRPRILKQPRTAGYAAGLAAWPGQAPAATAARRRMPASAPPIASDFPAPTALHRAAAAAPRRPDNPACPARAQAGHADTAPTARSGHPWHAAQRYD